MKIGKVIPILFIFLMSSCTGFYENKLKDQTVNLDSLLITLSVNDIVHIDESVFKTNINNANTFKELKQSFKLCSVVKHSFGVSFQFKCEELLERDPTHGDREYYLIKLFDLNSKGSLHGYEYWVIVLKNQKN